MKKRLFLLLFLPLQILAQLPETRIYLFDLERLGKSYTLTHPLMIGKKTGYNNQPYFSPDGNYLFYTSAVDTVNTELYKIDLRKKKLKSRRITKTPESEYSPKYTPDMEKISCVRVEKDTVTQHLYTYSLKGKSPVIIKPELTTIGYYEWLSAFEFVSFELPEPFYFVKHNLLNNKNDTLAQNIGRTFLYQKTKARLLYVDKSDSLHWKICSINPNEKKRTENMGVTIITETLPGTEDFCLLMDGSIMMGSEGKLYIKKNPFKNTNANWEVVMDLKTFGIKKFQRIATTYDNTKIAVVAIP